LYINLLNLTIFLITFIAFFSSYCRCNFLKLSVLILFLFIILQLLDKCINSLEEQIVNIESGILDDVLDRVVNYYVPADYAEICSCCKFPPKPVLDSLENPSEGQNPQSDVKPTLEGIAYTVNPTISMMGVGENHQETFHHYQNPYLMQMMQQSQTNMLSPDYQQYAASYLMAANQHMASSDLDHSNAQYLQYQYQQQLAHQYRDQPYSVEAMATLNASYYPQYDPMLFAAQVNPSLSGNDVVLNNASIYKDYSMPPGSTLPMLNPATTNTHLQQLSAEFLAGLQNSVIAVNVTESTSKDGPNPTGAPEAVSNDSTENKNISQSAVDTSLLATSLIANSVGDSIGGRTDQLGVTGLLPSIVSVPVPMTYDSQGYLQKSILHLSTENVLNGMGVKVNPSVSFGFDAARSLAPDGKAVDTTSQDAALSVNTGDFTLPITADSDTINGNAQEINSGNFDNVDTGAAPTALSSDSTESCSDKAVLEEPPTDIASSDTANVEVGGEGEIRSGANAEQVKERDSSALEPVSVSVSSSLAEREGELDGLDETDGDGDGETGSTHPSVDATNDASDISKGNTDDTSDTTDATSEAPASSGESATNSTGGAGSRRLSGRGKRPLSVLLPTDSDADTKACQNSAKAQAQSPVHHTRSVMVEASPSHSSSKEAGLRRSKRSKND